MPERPTAPKDARCCWWCGKPGAARPLGGPLEAPTLSEAIAHPAVVLVCGPRCEAEWEQHVASCEGSG